MSDLIVMAGATGDLGGRVAADLLRRGASVRALVRRAAAREKVERLRQLGAEIRSVDWRSAAELRSACDGATCVLSALAGLREVIVDRQRALLEAAVAAGAPRFIPSDFSVDFTKLPRGRNRNLDLRRALHRHLEGTPIAATSILCGAFADMLTGQMPLVLFKLRRVLYWRDADQPMDFTTIADTARFTARAALDPSTPRFLRIAGDQLSARGLAAAASAATGERFRLLRAGGLRLLGLLIEIARRISPGETELYPAWQGMQYMRDMFDGRAKLAQLDNARYPDMRWTTAREVLSSRRAG